MPLENPVNFSRRWRSTSGVMFIDGIIFLVGAAATWVVLLLIAEKYSVLALWALLLVALPFI